MTSHYAYHVADPFKTPRWWYDKNGVLCLMSMEQYLEETAKPKNRFKPTLFESLMPNLCIALSAGLIAFFFFSQLP